MKHAKKTCLLCPYSLVAYAYCHKTLLALRRSVIHQHDAESVKSV